MVLKALRDNDMITEKDLQAALTAAVRTAAYSPTNKKAPYFMDYLAQQLRDMYPPEVLNSLGLSIYTTIDMQIQTAAEQALSRGLERLEKGQPALRRDEPGKQLQGAIVVIDPNSGAIKALVGGRDYAVSQFNRVTQARRHNPVAVLIDMPIRHDTTRKLLDSLAGMDPAPPVILIVGETERFEAGKITSPRIAATLARPVVLRALHTDVQRAMGNAVASMSDASHDILRKEILRVMRTSMVSLPVMQQQA